MRFYGLGFAAVALAAAATVHGAVGQPLTMSGEAMYDLVITPYEAAVEPYIRPTSSFTANSAPWAKLGGTANLYDSTGAVVGSNPYFDGDGGHRFGSLRDQAFATQSLVDATFGAGVRVGLPDNGQISKVNGANTYNYQLDSSGFQDANGYTREGTGSSVVVMSTCGGVNGQVYTASKTVNVTQNKYESINILFQARRHNGNVATNYSATMIANYSDSTSQTLYSASGLYSGTAPGGSFGSAGTMVYDAVNNVGGGGWPDGNVTDGTGGNKGASDGNPLFTAGYAMNAGFQRFDPVGPPSRYFYVVANDFVLWTFSDGLALDPNKELVSLTFTTTTQGNNGSNSGYENGIAVFGVSGVIVPEPASIGLAGLALAGLGLRRRRA